MTTPLISFVVPTFNRVQWLPECLSGLLSQTVRDIEVVVVDDCSDDGTKELLESFYAKDPRVKLIFNERNLGGGLSRNVGNSTASAPLIGVCDSDDVYPQNRAECILQFFKENPEGVMMNSPYVRIGYNNEVLRQFDGEGFDETLFKEKNQVNYFCHPSAAYTKKDIEEIGGYKAEHPGATDDYQLVCDWIKAGKKIGLFMGHYLCLHRVLPDSMMSKYRGFEAAWTGK